MIFLWIGPLEAECEEFWYDKAENKSNGNMASAPLCLKFFVSLNVCDIFFYCISILHKYKTHGSVNRVYYSLYNDDCSVYFRHCLIVSKKYNFFLFFFLCHLWVFVPILFFVDSLEILWKHNSTFYLVYLSTSNVKQWIYVHHILSFFDSMNIFATSEMYHFCITKAKLVPS